MTYPECHTLLAGGCHNLVLARLLMTYNVQCQSMQYVRASNEAVLCIYDECIVSWGSKAAVHTISRPTVPRPTWTSTTIPKQQNDASVKPIASQLFSRKLLVGYRVTDDIIGLHRELHDVRYLVLIIEQQHVDALHGEGLLAAAAIAFACGCSLPMIKTNLHIGQAIEHK